MQSATTSVVLDRMVGFVTIAMVIAISLPWSLELIDDRAARWSLFLIIASLVGVLIAGLGICWFMTRREFRWDSIKFLQKMITVTQRVLISLPLVIKTVVASALILPCGDVPCDRVAVIATAA